MRRIAPMVVVAIGLVGNSMTVGAGPPHRDANLTWWQKFKLNWHRSNAWPEPFPKADRAFVQAPLERMVANGWRRQNLMAAHHFTGDGASLTPAGQHKIRWILTQTPAQFRTVFVERGEDADQTHARLDAVQQYAARMLPHGELPDVQETHIVEEGRPASIVDTVFTRFQQAMPVPVLPDPSTDTMDP